MSGTVIWRGEDGTPYEYKVFDLDPGWNDVPGNYIFARWDGESWIALYIGETSSFKDRLNNLQHHQAHDCAERRGMTAIHAHTGSREETVRRNEEFNLIRKLSPPCNVRSR